MAPKKGAPVKDKKDLAPTCGLFAETCSLMPWDDQDLQFENWGGELNNGPISAVDPNSLFTDAEFHSTLEACFGSGTVVDWKRPSAYFSPFKPVVFRSALANVINPYEYNGKEGRPLATPRPDGGPDEEDDGEPPSREAAIRAYRRIKPLVVPDGVALVDAAAAGVDATILAGSSSPVRRTRKRAHHHENKAAESSAASSYFMRAFNAAVALLSENQCHIPAGQYAWELIYPQAPGTTNPIYNPWGKYAVKLFVGGAFRRITVDDRLPVDSTGVSLITVTEQKEIWPAILLKAMLKALGPHFEDLVVANPLVVASFLLPGWCPQRVCVKTSAMTTLTTLRGMLRSPSEGEEVPILSATIGDCTAPEPHPSHHSPGHDNHEHSVLSIDSPPATRAADVATSLSPRQVFAVLAVKPYQTTTLIRLCAPYAQWNGQYAYDKPVWTHAFEAAISFTPRKDRDLYALKACGWVDFWVSFEEFTETFNSLLVWRNMYTGKAFSVFRQYTPPSADGAAPAAAGKGPAPAASATAATLGATTILAAPPSSWSRWMYVKVPEAQQKQFLFLSTGLPKSLNSGLLSQTTSQQATPRGHTGALDGTTEAARTGVVVEHFRWASSAPLSFVAKLDVHAGITHCNSFSVPAGTHVFRVTANHLPPGCGISVASDSDFALGDEKEICQALLQVSSVSDAGVFAAHPPTQSTIWFKRLIAVKHATTANFVLSTLPRGTDVSLHRSVAHEGVAAAGAKGGKPAAPPPKPSKGAVVADTAADVMDEVDHEVPITAYAKLILLNLDTGVLVSDTALKILGAQLAPNSKGYLLMAFASIPRDAKETYGRGLWKLQAASDRAFDTFEQRGFEEITSRQAEYVHNDYNTLFKYNFSVVEPATGTIQLNLQETWGIPFHVTLLHNDKEIDARRDAKGSCMFEHVTLAPSDKAAPSIYSIHCVLDSKFTTEWEERRRVQVVQLFQKNCQEQESILKLKQEELARKILASESITTDGFAPALAASTSVSPSVPPAGGGEGQQVEPGTEQQLFSIPFQLLLHLSTSKVEVKEDNTIQEHLTQVKASWAKKDAEAAGAAQPTGKPAKAPAKGQVVVDESQLRQQRSKESRERFLQNLKGVFMPYVKDGKPVLDFTAESTFQRAPIMPPGSYSHEVPASGPIDPSPCVVVAASPVPGAIEGGGKGAAAALPPPGNVATLAPHVMHHFKHITTDAFDRVNHLSASFKHAKKDVVKAQHDAVLEYWAVHRPDKGGLASADSAAAGADDEKGKKPPAKGGKK